MDKNRPADWKVGQAVDLVRPDTSKIPPLDPYIRLVEKPHLCTQADLDAALVAERQAMARWLEETVGVPNIRRRDGSSHREYPIRSICPEGRQGALGEEDEQG